jgi:hypothetical protein
MTLITFGFATIYIVVVLLICKLLNIDTDFFGTWPFSIIVLIIAGASAFYVLNLTAPVTVFDEHRSCIQCRHPVKNL